MKGCTVLLFYKIKMLRLSMASNSIWPHAQLLLLSVLQYILVSWSLCLEITCGVLEDIEQAWTSRVRICQYLDVTNSLSGFYFVDMSDINIQKHKMFFSLSCTKIHNEFIADCTTVVSYFDQPTCHEDIFRHYISKRLCQNSDTNDGHTSRTRVQIVTDIFAPETCPSSPENCLNYPMIIVYVPLNVLSF